MHHRDNRLRQSVAWNVSSKAFEDEHTKREEHVVHAPTQGRKANNFTYFTYLFGYVWRNQGTGYLAALGSHLKASRVHHAVCGNLCRPLEMHGNYRLVGWCGRADGGTFHHR